MDRAYLTVSSGRASLPVICCVVGRCRPSSLLAQRSSGSYVSRCFFSRILSSSPVQKSALSVGKYPMQVFMIGSGLCCMVSIAVDARIMIGIVAGWIPFFSSVWASHYIENSAGTQS